MQRFCLTLPLRPDPALIAEYIRLHQDVWPEVRKSIYDAGVTDMQIYQVENRLFMIMETTDDFDFERKAAMDAANPRVVEWETLMARFQQVADSDDPTRKWMVIPKIFQLS